jgi:DNA mismatch endonuclease (patch repair protein)
LRRVIFVNGCFWHGHACKRGARQPKTNADYWRRKIAGNVTRDENTLRELHARGWSALTVWECQTKVSDRPSLGHLLATFLGPR